MRQADFVSVIIPTYKDWDRLNICLDSLVTQTLAIDRFEVIVVNNDPNDSYKLENRPINFHLIVEATPGSYAARNAGLRIAKGNFIAFTDSDCIPQQDWLSSAIRYLEQYPEIDRVSGAVLISPVTENSEYINTFEKLFAFPQKAYAKEGLAVTANLISRSAVFDAVGPFDDNFLSGGDHEWCHRAEMAGFKLSYHNACIVYHPARTKSQIMKKTRRLYPNYLKRKVGDKSFIYALAFGPFLLRPSMKMVKLLFKEFQAKKVTILQCIRIYSLMYEIRLVQFKEHYKLLFGSEKERQ